MPKKTTQTKPTRAEQTSDKGVVVQRLVRPLPISGEADCPKCGCKKSVSRHNADWNCQAGCGFHELVDPDRESDTPRTDAWLAEEKRNPRLSGLGNWLNYCKQLERELTAARAEIERLNFSLKQASSIYDVVTEQRDRLAEALKPFIDGWSDKYCDSVVTISQLNFANEALQSLTPPEPK